MRKSADRQWLAGVLVMLGAWVLACSCATFRHPRLTTRIKAHFCEPVETLGNLRPNPELRALEAEGEAAREVLLRLAATSDEYRMCACGWLKLLGDARLVPIARRFLDDPNTPASQLPYFVGYLATFRDGASYDRVLEFLRTGNQETQDMAIEYLGSIPTDRARAELRRLAVMPKWWGNARVAGALGRQRDPEAVPILIDYATRGDPVLYTYLAVALAQIPTTAAQNEAQALLGKIRAPDDRERTIRRIVEALTIQRRQTDDSVEQASIDETIARFKKLSKPIGGL